MRKKQENLRVNTKRFYNVYHEPVKMRKKIQIWRYKLELMRKGVESVLQDIKEHLIDLKKHEQHIIRSIKNEEKNERESEQA